MTMIFRYSSFHAFYSSVPAPRFSFTRGVSGRLRQRPKSADTIISRSPRKGFQKRGAPEAFAARALVHSLFGLLNAFHKMPWRAGNPASEQSAFALEPV